MDQFVPCVPLKKREKKTINPAQAITPQAF